MSKDINIFWMNGFRDPLCLLLKDPHPAQIIISIIQYRFSFLIPFVKYLFTFWLQKLKDESWNFLSFFPQKITTIEKVEFWVLLYILAPSSNQDVELIKHSKWNYKNTWPVPSPLSIKRRGLKYYQNASKEHPVFSDNKEVILKRNC